MIIIYLTETKSILTDGDWKKLWMEAGNANSNLKNTVDSSDSPAFDDTEVSDNSCIFQFYVLNDQKIKINVGKWPRPRHNDKWQRPSSTVTETKRAKVEPKKKKNEKKKC